MLNSTNTKPNSKITTHNRKHTAKGSKSFWLKTINSVIKWETLNRISDFQLHRLASSTMNWRLLATILKLFKGELKNSVVSIRRLPLIMRTKLDCCHRNSKDSIVLLKEKTIKLERWEEKSKALNKISGFQRLKPQSLAKNLFNTSHSSKSTINNLKPTDKKFRNSWAKTTNSVTKWEMPNKTCGFLPHKSVNWTTNSK